MNRQAVRVLVDERRVGVELDRAAGHRIRVAVESIGPGVEQRDAHGRAGRLVAGEAAALAEELVASMGERAADHPDGRREGRLELGLGRDQRLTRIALEEDLTGLVGRGHGADDRTRNQVRRRWRRPGLGTKMAFCRGRSVVAAPEPSKLVGRVRFPSPALRRRVVSNNHGAWRSLVAHSAGGRKVAGSNPVAPTRSKSRSRSGFSD